MGIYGSGVASLTGVRISPSLAIALSVLLALALMSIVVEVARRAAGRSNIPASQFILRLTGGGLMALVVLLIAFGCLFVRPEDGRIFAWFWAFCSLLLFCSLLIVRVDLKRTRQSILEEARRSQSASLASIQEILSRSGKKE